jgi:hypothetical protein
VAANRQSDSTVTSFSETLQDVVTTPSSPEQISAWYQIDGQALQSTAQADPNSDPGLAEAIADHAITFISASDIPDLTFHNTISIQGGENGNSVGEEYTFNHNASIFSDPATSYKVMSDGTVISWKTPAASNATASS